MPAFHGSAGLGMHGMNRRAAVEVNSAQKAYRHTHEDHVVMPESASRHVRLAETSPVNGRRQVSELAD